MFSSARSSPTISYAQVSPPLPTLKSPVTPPFLFPAITKTNSFFLYNASDICLCFFPASPNHLPHFTPWYHTIFQTGIKELIFLTNISARERKINPPNNYSALIYLFTFNSLSLSSIAPDYSYRVVIS